MGRLLSFLIISMMLCAVFTHAVQAQDDPRWEANQGDLPPTCDSDFMEVLEARSWLEGKREVEYAQKLILKADSTLEYACFSQRLNELDNPGATWSNRRANMSRALGRLVTGPINTYLGNNFAHTLGGGTFNGSASGCNVMYKIWDFLKCKHYDQADFAETFETLVSNDPRQLPEPCPGGERNSIWAKAVEAAFPDANTPAQNGGMEALQSYVGLFTGTCSQSEPIETGVQVVRADGTSYEEKVCLPAGCSWNVGDQYCH